MSTQSVRFALPYTIGNLSARMGGISIAAEEEQVGATEQKVHDYATDTFQQEVIATSHKRAIWRLKVLPQNKIASASYDRTARILSQHPDSKEWTACTLKGHKREVLSLGCLDETTLITGSSDGLLKFWDTTNGVQKKSFGEPKYAIRGFYSLALIGPDTIATGSCHRPKKVQSVWNHEIKLWDIPSGKKRETLSGHTGGISTLINLGGDRLLSTSADTTIGIWDTNQPKCVTMLNGHSDYVYCGAFLATIQRVATGGRDRSIKLWDLETGQWDLLVNQGGLVAHESTVYDLAPFQRDLLISGSRDSQVRIWDPRTLSSVRTIDVPFFVHAVGASGNADILAGGPGANGKKPREGGDLAIFKFI